MIIIGVDPGAKGGVTILNTYAFREVQCLSLTHNTYADIYRYLSEIKGGEPCRAARINYVRTVAADGPIQPLEEKEIPYDNTMEMYLEEPGQIIPNAKGKTTAMKLLAGMTASRKLGRTVGIWEGLAIALNISVVLVPPMKWQRTILGTTSKGDKNMTKNAAIDMFPVLTRNGKSRITHDIADSLLIALYGYLQYVPSERRPHSVRKNILSYKDRQNDRSRTSKSTTRYGPPIHR